MNRIMRWAARSGALLLGILLLSSVFYPDLVGQVIAHATPDNPLIHNAITANIEGGAVLATTAAASTRSISTVLTELKALRDAWKGKPMPEAEGAKFEALATEAAAMQDELDRDKAVRLAEDAEKASRQVLHPTVPADTSVQETPEQKSERTRREQRETAGYMRLGDYVTLSGGFREFHRVGKPQAQMLMAKGRGIRLFDSARDAMIALNREQIAVLRDMSGEKGFGGALELKAVPTIDDLVIEPQRLADIVRVTENDRVTLRDVLDVQRTSSNAIEYVRITNYSRAAEAVAQAALKPEAAMTLDTVMEVVRTIAVWLPVNNQQLDDLPALAGMINGELLYDVRKRVEELVVYGDGVGQNFAGIIPNALVLPMGENPGGSSRLEGDDTLIDIARRGLTDVRKAGYEPNAILVDPIDWEDIVLEKGTDNRYVWVVVTEAGVQRLWGVPVIETSAMENFEGVATEERNMLVGDFRRGATLYDRQDAAVSVGWINDQFVRNQRTILAELRAAFALKRPGAFRKHQTQAASAS